MNPEDENENIFDNNGSYEDNINWDEPEYPEEHDVTEDYALEDRYSDY